MKLYVIFFCLLLLHGPHLLITLLKSNCVVTLFFCL